MTRRQLLLVLAVAAAALVAFVAWPRPRSDGFVSYELAPSSLTPGPLIKLHTYNMHYPLGTVSPEPQAVKKEMMSRAPGVFRKMLVAGSDKFAIRNERNGLFLAGTDPAGKRTYGMPMAGWGPRASLWTAKPAEPGTCLGKPSFVRLVDEAGRALQYRMYMGTKKKCSQQDPDCNGGARTMYVENLQGQGTWNSCWML